jgi:hypothetical protein
VPPKRKATQEELADEVAIPLKHKRHDNSDPREPLPVGTTTGEATKLPSKGEKRTAEDLSSRYARNLIAYDGDLEKALSKTFGISEEEAALNLAELHDRARGASRVNTNMVDMMERHDLTIEPRLAKLREHMFSPIPAVSLKAIDAITELDATAKSRRIGTSWETFVARVRAGAGPKARAQAEGKPKKLTTS